MSILSDRDIAKAMRHGEIGFGDPARSNEPVEEWRIQPASIEVTLNGADGSLLGYTFPRASKESGTGWGFIDPEDPPAMVPRPWARHLQSARRYYLLSPGEFLLGSTAETVAVGTGLCAAIEGKSSLGRLGLQIHSTARFIDPKWRGRLTLELFNTAPRPIRLWAGMRVGQIRFERLSSPSERSYGDESLGSHYQGSHGTVQARSVKYGAPERTLLAGGESGPIHHPV